MTKTGMIAIISIVVGGVILIYVVLALSYWGERSGQIQLSYDAFYNLYKVCPSKWRLDYECVYYENNTYDSYYPIYFKSYYDSIRYKMMRQKIEKEKRDFAKDKVLLELADHWQHDVDEYRNKYLAETKEIIDQIKGGRSL